LINDGYFEVIGVSVPVWYHNSETSEPANEIFCKYKIKTTESDIFVRYKANEYIVHLPKCNANFKYDDLRDLKDGGIESMDFLYPGRLRNNNKYIRVMHLVQIKDITELIDTMS
jgi:hypothetical protein